MPELEAVAHLNGEGAYYESNFLPRLGEKLGQGMRPVELKGLLLKTIEEVFGDRPTKHQYLFATSFGKAFCERETGKQREGETLIHTLYRKFLREFQDVLDQEWPVSEGGLKPSLKDFIDADIDHDEADLAIYQEALWNGIGKLIQAGSSKKLVCFMEEASQELEARFSLDDQAHLHQFLTESGLSDIPSSYLKLANLEGTKEPVTTIRQAMVFILRLKAGIASRKTDKETNQYWAERVITAQSNLLRLTTYRRAIEGSIRKLRLKIVRGLASADQIKSFRSLLTLPNISIDKKSAKVHLKGLKSRLIQAMSDGGRPRRMINRHFAQSLKLIDDCEGIEEDSKDTVDQAEGKPSDAKEQENRIDRLGECTTSPDAYNEKSASIRGHVTTKTIPDGSPSPSSSTPWLLCLSVGFGIILVLVFLTAFIAWKSRKHRSSRSFPALIA